jgi:hypothetical protein
MNPEFTTKLAILIISIFFLSSCASYGPFQVNANRRNLDHLRVGMSKSEVLSVMGAPYQREVFPGQDNIPVEVLLYQTKFVGMAIPPSDEELTPIVFRNNQLIGWGRNFYDTTKKYEFKHDIEIR